MKKKCYLVFFVLVLIGFTNCGPNIWDKAHSYAPQIQKDFESKRWNFYKSYDAAPNDIKKSAIWVNANNYTKQFVKKNEKFTKWVGIVKSIYTDQGGATVELKIESNLYFDRSLNDVSYHTYNKIIPNSLPKKGSKVYNQISDLAVDDFVYFSGIFIKDEKKGIYERSLTENGSLEEPEFEVIFTNIEKFTIK